MTNYRSHGIFGYEPRPNTLSLMGEICFDTRALKPNNMLNFNNFSNIAPILDLNDLNA